MAQKVSLALPPRISALKGASPITHIVGAPVTPGLPRAASLIGDEAALFCPEHLFTVATKLGRRPPRPRREQVLSRPGRRAFLTVPSAPGRPRTKDGPLRGANDAVKGKIFIASDSCTRGRNPAVAQVPAAVRGAAAAGAGAFVRTPRGPAGGSSRFPEAEPGPHYCHRWAPGRLLWQPAGSATACATPAARTPRPRAEPASALGAPVVSAGGRAWAPARASLVLREERRDGAELRLLSTDPRRSQFPAHLLGSAPTCAPGGAGEARLCAPGPAGACAGSWRRRAGRRAARPWGGQRRVHPPARAFLRAAAAFSFLWPLPLSPAR